MTDNRPYECIIRVEQKTPESAPNYQEIFILRFLRDSPLPMEAIEQIFRIILNSKNNTLASAEGYIPEDKP